MALDARKYLFDMYEAGRLIAEFTAGKSFGQYEGDACLRSAVERQFQIIGEALTQLARHHCAIASKIPGHREIIGFRNVLVHGYDKVEDEVVWGIVKVRLPDLLRTLNSLLTE